METKYRAWFDGGCFPKNPGGYASYGALISKDDEIIWQGSGLVIPVTDTSCNLAEYAGYIAVLMELERQKLREHPVTIYGDSQLVIKQMRGERKIKSGLYVDLAHKAKRLTHKFPNIRLEWIPREHNHQADWLAAQALYQNGSICMRCMIAEEARHRSCSCYCHTRNESRGFTA
jgi:ribonuclease HI